MRWTLGTLLGAADIDAVRNGPDADPGIAGLAYDSRTVSTGDLFCCFAGERADGHDHAQAATEAGAAALLVERPLPLAVPQAVVERVRPVLGPLSAAFFDHPSRAMAVAGITGTNGKTTVSFVLESIAVAAGLGVGRIGTVEYRIGEHVEPAVRTTPEAIDLQRLLARMREEQADVVAMEVASHALDQGRVDGTWFACVAFTNLSQDHLDYHGTLERYFEAKASLFDPRFARRAAINVDDPWGRRVLERARGLDVLTFGPSGDVGAEDVAFDPLGSAFRLRTPLGTADVETSLVGPYNVSNVLCATAVAVQLGLSLDVVAAGIRTAAAPAGRLERVEIGQPFSVLVDYAHTPDALERALQASRTLTDGRLIVVFGCGGDRDPHKRPLMGEIAARLSDLAIVTSDNPRSEDPDAIIAAIVTGADRTGGTLRIEPDRREAIRLAVAGAAPGDVVLIAGKGHERGQTFADRTVPFHDRSVAQELLEELV
jgi:UDP-N-acetylmuramoyl-L-alanyl-D-glutamate--2,6-diaminopimelate ligase